MNFQWLHVYNTQMVDGKNIHLILIKRKCIMWVGFDQMEVFNWLEDGVREDRKKTNQQLLFRGLAVSLGSKPNIIQSNFETYYFCMCKCKCVTYSTCNNSWATLSYSIHTIYSGTSGRVILLKYQVLKWLGQEGEGVRIKIFLKKSWSQNEFKVILRL